VRTFLKGGVKGFRSVCVIERTQQEFDERDVAENPHYSNKRTYNNREAMERVSSQYGTFIMLEEDIICHPLFLEYMNFGLNRWADDDRVLAICGFNPVESAEKSSLTSFMSLRFFGWGFGMRREWWESIIWDNSSILSDSRTERRALKMISDCRGNDLYPYFVLQAKKLIDAGDVAIDYTGVIGQRGFVTPSISLTVNSGLDGSGTHTLNVWRPYKKDLTINNPETNLQNLKYPIMQIARIKSFYDKSIFRRVISILLWKVREYRQFESP